ncbi:hypothetical protein PHET_07044 [Paragonimus heterotremus]|uniref:Uncharacterized protein n=1 Tax=Paragonimus heterotremus TaxID=100268 RepID=A0A8J4WFW3_9TREM|nr:hypothetical protein PHET_07044 [Paragonimus heterotremus]
MTSMQSSGSLHTYLKDMSCRKFNHLKITAIFLPIIWLSLVALGVLTPEDYRWLTLQTTAELYAPIDRDIQRATQNVRGERDFKKLALYMDGKVGSQKLKST